jgi:hypothetical protein
MRNLRIGLARSDPTLNPRGIRQPPDQNNRELWMVICPTKDGTTKAFNTGAPASLEFGLNYSDYKMMTKASNRSLPFIIHIHQKKIYTRENRSHSRFQGFQPPRPEHNWIPPGQKDKSILMNCMHEKRNPEFR